jgi:hypothetical protein
MAATSVLAIIHLIVRIRVASEGVADTEAHSGVATMVIEAEGEGSADSAVEGIEVGAYRGSCLNTFLMSGHGCTMMR